MSSAVKFPPPRPDTTIRNFPDKDNTDEDSSDEPKNNRVESISQKILGEIIFTTTLKDVQQEYRILQLEEELDESRQKENSLKRELESKELELFTASKRIKELEGMLLGKPSKSE
jgi:hypothetical protein